jgi:spermidine/putrescine transport system permease protein
MRTRSIFSKAITGVVFCFLYLPIVVLIINSFNSSRLGGNWGGWTLQWYLLLFEDEQIWYALKNSINVALASTLCSTVLGTLTAFCLHLYRSRLQKFHSLLIYTLLIVPEVHMGISLMLFFIASSIPSGLVTIFIAHTTFSISYVTMVMLACFEDFDFALVEAAMDLGANWSSMLRKVFFPLLRPGLIASALLAFALSLDDFVITFFVAGPGATTLPLYIYSMTKFGSPPLINALSTLLLTITFIAAWTSQQFAFGKAKKSKLYEERT